MLGSGELIQREDLPNELRGMDYSDGPSSFHEAVTAKKKDLILKAVVRSGGKMTEAARYLNLQPTYLHRLVRNLDLRSDIKKALVKR